MLFMLIFSAMGQVQICCEVLIVWYCADATCLLLNQQHMIADTVRMIRHCQSDQPGNEVIGVDSAEVRASVHYLHIIDNQQTLFELSHKLEPRA